MPKGKRPLSPHLQVYRPQITSILSITHRLTGVALAGGALLLAQWVLAASYGEEAFALAQSLLGSWFGQLILLGLTFALFYHLANGLRHLAWDAGWGYEMDKLTTSGWTVVAFSVAMTGLTFIGAYAAAGVF